MKFIVFYLQSINSLEGPGMFFSSAAIIRRLRKYTATLSFRPNIFAFLKHQQRFLSPSTHFESSHKTNSILYISFDCFKTWPSSGCEGSILHYTRFAATNRGLYCHQERGKFFGISLLMQCVDFRDNENVTHLQI